jgi:hypothetical protein
LKFLKTTEVDDVIITEEALAVDLEEKEVLD